MSNLRKARGFAVLFVLFALVGGLAQPAFGQAITGPFTSFPSDAIDDGRFLSLVNGLQGLSGERATLGLSVPAGETSFGFRIFDGDTRKPCVAATDPTCLVPSFGHWDEGGTEIVVKMYFDNDRDGVVAPADPGDTLIGTWRGNAVNGTSGPPLPSIPGSRWLGEASMPDNDWWDLEVFIDPTDAASPSGERFYFIDIVLDPLANDGATVSNFKVSSNVPLSIFSASFGFEAAAGGSVNDLAILYPGFDLTVTDPNFFVNDPQTTFDGSFQFFLDVSVPIEDFRVWDGDFDFGTGSTAGFPSGVPFSPCTEGDDPDSPLLPPFAGPNAQPEGAKPAGSPADDNRVDAFRRSPCIVYTVIDPNGVAYTNVNPSGNLEWEQFLITTNPATPADYGPTTAADGETFVAGDVLPAGIWTISVEGLDIGNSNFWRFELAACSLVDGAPACPPEPYLIGDEVFFDTDGSTTRDPGEPGVPGVVLDVLDDDGDPIDQRVTDEDGIYNKDVLPGTYTVRLSDINFTPEVSGAVGDRVWLDANGDGVQDAGEPGIANVRVQLFDVGANTVIASTRTDMNGNYLFDGLPPGSYETRVDDSTLPAGLSLSGGTDPSATRVITADEIFLDLDFGYTPAGAALGDYVWSDADGDGIQDAGEPGIGGVVLDLVDTGAAMVVATTTTAADGGYLFTGLAAATYEVVVRASNFAAGGALDGYTVTVGAESEGANTSAPRVLGATDVDLSVDFGYDRPGLLSITDRVWFDADADGLYEPGDGDLPIAGVTVVLVRGAENVIASATSDSDGLFSFDGLEGGGAFYTLRLTDQAGALYGLVGTTQPGLDYSLGQLLDAVPLVGDNFGYVNQGRLAGYQVTTADSITDTVVDQNILTYDFGLRLGSLGDRVWFDADLDGFQDPGEFGLVGVTVRLLDADGVEIDSTVTVADGIYGFDMLPAGDYTVVVDATTLPPGLSPTYDLDGIGTPDVADATLGAGQDRVDVDFGYGVVCALSVDKSCQITPAPEPFDCGDAKPLDLVAMTWDGSETINVKAWKGSVGSTLLATVNGVAPGDTVSVTGYAGSPNDVFWQVFRSYDGQLLGQSNFHLSCSDDEMDGPEDCGKLEGNGKGDDADLINQWRLDGLGGSGLTLDCTPAPPVPADLCEATLPPAPDCDNLDKPTSLTFVYSGGGCPGENDQGSKTECSGTVNGGQAANVSVDDNGLSVSPTIVSPGEEFTVSGSFGSSTVITLSNGGGSQVNDVHTSCSAPLAVGDEFGAITVTAFSGQRGGVEVDYLYQVTNNGAPLTGVTLVDDVLGPVGGPIDLPMGGSELFTVEALVTDSVINQVDVSGVAFGPTECFASDTAEVVLIEPCDVCKGGVTDLIFQYLGAQAAEVEIYDDNDAKLDKLLFEGLVQPGDLIPITKRPDKDKFDSTISLWIDGIQNVEIHTSCSQPIGAGLIVGEFQIVEARSKDNGLVCPLDICDPDGSAGLELHDRELRWPIVNNGDAHLVIERITVQWPAANGVLEEIKREGDTIHEGEFAPPSAVIDSGWKGDADKRTIEVGKDDTLKLKFDNDAVSGDYLVTVEFDQGCSVSTTFEPPPPGATLDCSKPIDALTMIWDGTQPVRVKAWKGSVGSTLLADVDNVAIGQELTVSGFAGSPNDVVWEIFAAGTSTQLGESKFHLSCSDSAMDGPEDCGSRQGDGKSDESSLINDWLFEGMVDSDETLDCTP